MPPARIDDIDRKRRRLEFCQDCPQPACAHVRTDDVAMLRTLRRLGAGSAEKDGAMVNITLALPETTPAPERITT